MQGIGPPGLAEREWEWVAATLYGLARTLSLGADAAELRGEADAWTRVGGRVGFGVLALLAAAGEELTAGESGNGSLASLTGVIHEWVARHAPAGPDR